MGEPIARSALDITKIDMLKCGDYVISEILDKSQPIWSIFRYKDSYVFFTATLIKGPDGKPALGYELDRDNLEKLFKGEHFNCKMVPIPEILP